MIIIRFERSYIHSVERVAAAGAVGEGRMKSLANKVSIRTRRRWVASLMALFLLLWNEHGLSKCLAANNAEEKTGNLYALSAVLMDGESGRVLLGKEEEVMRPMASTTKIMTCILALELGTSDEIVSATKNAAAQPKVHIGMQENEQYFLEDLLYSLMLESHNDSAVAIAEHIAGSVESFADLMNEKAQEIGCEHTHFVTPNGLDQSDEEGSHSTTAADLARIMSYCVLKSPKSEEFLKITQTRSYSFREITGKRTVSCTNHNALLDSMEGAISGKTGFTGEAGYCYVGAVTREGRTFVVALLGCGWPNNKSYKWKDARQLIEYGMAHYHYKDIWKELDVSKRSVENGISYQTELFDEAYTKIRIKAEEEELEYLLSEEEEVKVQINWREPLTAPVEKGEIVGEISYSIADEKIASYEIVTCEKVEKEHFLWFFEQLYARYMRLQIPD